MSSTPNEPQDPRSGAAGQYGQAGGKYGTTEYNPNQYTGAVERPGTVDRLLKLTMISLGVYVLSGILGFIMNSTVDLVQVYRNMGMSTEIANQSADRAAGIGGPIGSIISMVIGIVLYLLVWNNLKKGKNWARVLGTVFAALAIVGGIFSILGAFIYPAPWNIILIVVALVKIVVDILWIVTAFRAPNTAWFNQNQVQR